MQVSTWWLVVLIPLMVAGALAAMRALAAILESLDESYAHEKLMRMLTGTSSSTRREVVDHPGAIDTYLETEE